MDQSLGKLTVYLGTDLTQLNKGLSSAITQVTSFSKQAALAIGAVTTAMIAGVKSAADYGEEIYRLHKVTGMSTESLSRLQYAAEQNETSIGAVTTGLRFLTRNLDQAQGGNTKLALTFSRLGISVNELRGASPEQLLETLSSAFSQVTDSSTRTALAVEIFGRAGVSLLPFLSIGSDEMKRLADRADALGVTLTQAQAKAFDTFNDNLADMQTYLKGVWISIANDVIPALNNFMKALQQTDLIKDLVGGLKNVLETLMKLPTWLQLSATAATLLSTALGKTLFIILALPDAIKGWQKILFQYFAAMDTAILNTYKFLKYPKSAIDEVQKDLDKLTIKIEALYSAPGDTEKIIGDLQRLKDVLESPSAGGVKPTGAGTGTEGTTTGGVGASGNPYDTFGQQSVINDTTTNIKALQSLYATLQEMHVTVKAGLLDLTNTALKTFSTGVSSAITSIIMGTKTAGQAFKELGMAMIEAIVSFVVQWGVQALISMALGSLLMTATAGQAAALATAWSPAATLASIATLGAAAGIGAGAVVAALGTTQGVTTGMSSFAGVMAPSDQQGWPAPDGFADGGWAGLNGPERILVGEEGPEFIVKNDDIGKMGTTINLQINVDAQVTSNVDIETLANELGSNIEKKLKSI